MKSIIYSLGLAMLFLLPGVALSQGYINWPATEDTIIVPGSSTLNVFIGSDTAGTGPQGAHGQVAWQNRNRVYVLLAGQRYGWSAVCSLSVAHRSLYIRGENGKDYTIPSTLTSVKRPVLRSITSPLVTAWFVLNADDQIFAMRNVCWTAYDENINPTDLRNATGTFITCGTNARPTAAELVAARETHIPATAQQTQHHQVAGADHALLASVNHGHPSPAAPACCSSRSR